MAQNDKKRMTQKYKWGILFADRVYKKNYFKVCVDASLKKRSLLNVNRCPQKKNLLALAALLVILVIYKTFEGKRNEKEPF